MARVREFESEPDEEYVEPLSADVIDPLTVDPVNSATAAIDIVPQPVSARSADSPYTALLTADQLKTSSGPIRTTGVSIPAADRVDELDENADIDPEDRVPEPGSAPSETTPNAAQEPVSASSAEQRIRATAVGYRPESSDSLTAERLLQPRKHTQPEPTGALNRFIYALTLHQVNRGDSPKVAAHKLQTAAISKRLPGSAKFVPVLTRKGGVGKTTVTALLGMALADARDDRVIALDANPDRGTLAERFERQTEATVRDVVSDAERINGFTDFSAYVSRDITRLDVLASDTDPNLSEAFNGDDYDAVASVASGNYSIVLTDCGTGIVHSVMRPVLGRADVVVVVTGSSVDEVRLASETLTWLEHNGHAELVANAVVAVNLATQGAHLVKLAEVESHFASRARAVVRIPYDPSLAAGSSIDWTQLQPATRQAARDLAQAVVEGIPAA